MFQGMIEKKTQKRTRREKSDASNNRSENNTDHGSMEEVVLFLWGFRPLYLKCVDFFCYKTFSRLPEMGNIFDMKPSLKSNAALPICTIRELNYIRKGLYDESVQSINISKCLCITLIQPAGPFRLSVWTVYFILKRGSSLNITD